MPTHILRRYFAPFLAVAAAITLWSATTLPTHADEEFGDWTIIIRHAAVQQKPEFYEGEWPFPISSPGADAVYDAFKINFKCRTNHSPTIHVFGKELHRFQQTANEIEKYFFENCPDTPEPDFGRIITKIDPRNPTDDAMNELVAEMESYFNDGNHIWVLSGQIIAKLNSRLKEFGAKLPIVQSDEARCRLYFSYWEWRRTDDNKQTVRRFPINYTCTQGDCGCPRCSPIRP